MNNKSFDLIIIGGGNAGFGVSAVAAEAGKSIAFIEQAEFGGTCPNRGCTPKKILVAAAKSLDEIARAPQHGITVSKPQLDWKKLISRKEQLISYIPDAMLGVAQKRGEVYKGQAKFIGPNRIAVNGEILEGKDIVIATGSKTRPLPVEGAEHMITSDEVLSNTTLPEEIIFIGGGVIAMEFSHVYARAGVRVTILEVMPQLLPRLDSDAVAVLQQATEQLGVTIKTEVAVKKITKSADRLEVIFEHQGNEQRLLADTVVNGAGRIANIDGLDLAAANIKFDGLRIETDQHLRSISNPRVWVAGDSLLTSPQLSPVATYEGRIVGHNIVSNDKVSPQYAALPSAVYTIPTLSNVGITEHDARTQQLDVQVSTSDMSSWFSSTIHAQNTAWAKIIIDNATDYILGAHFVGHHGEELINLFAMAMRYNITATKLKEDLYAYPTFASDIKNLW